MTVTKHRANLFKITIMMLVVSAVTYAQEGSVPVAIGNTSRGKIEAIDFDRVYVRRGGRNIGEQRERVYSERYDDRGRISETTWYGNGSKKETHFYSDDSLAVQVAYFDTAGRPANSFKPNTDIVDESGLCSDYRLRTESDAEAKIERKVEICTDGSLRATTVIEVDENGNIFRSTRIDAKSRKREAVYQYDSDENITEYRNTVFPVGKLAYTHTSVFSDYRYDDQGNWIRRTVTSFISTRPGELVFQFNDIQKITYRK